MDEELRRWFAELRAADRAHAPGLEVVLGRAARPRPARMRALRAAALVAAILLVGLWPRHTRRDVAPMSITQWRAATDYLLRTPGRQLLTELPALDRSILTMERSR